MTNSSVLVGEFLGTFLLVLLGNGAVANVLLPKSKGESSGWIVIATGWGLAVAFGIYLSAALSGAHINPAVSVAFAVSKKITWDRLPFYLIGQFSGAFIGALAVALIYWNHFTQQESSEKKLLCFSTYPAIKNSFHNFLSEVIATFVLVLGVFALLNQDMNTDPSLNPYLIGFLVFSIGLSLGGTTGYAINPARDLGPRVAHSLLFGRTQSKWSYAWIPFFGPLVGAVLASGAYGLLLMLWPQLIARSFA